MKYLKHNLGIFLFASLVSATAQGGFAETANLTATQSVAQAALQTPKQLQQLVAPIALYPDALVGQILAGSTYPDQVVVADRWMQQHHDLNGQSLGQAVNQQPWDPSVQALTQFPSVLANMDKNLSWTSALGDAYVNQQQDVMDAVQTMRRQARKAGHLESTPQETVTTQGQTIVVQSTSPEIVYVPEYDPWAVYGAPMAVYPNWVSEPGLYIAGPGIAFGDGFGIGLFAGYGWGWRHWGSDWHRHSVIYNHTTYISHSRTFANRHNVYHGSPHFSHAAGFHGGSPAGNSASHAAHGSVASRIQPGSYPSPFSGRNHGNIGTSQSSRGKTGFGGGFQGSGGFHSTGGIHGGGFHSTGGFHGGGSFHNAGGFHGGGGFHSGGGFHGGGGHR